MSQKNQTYPMIAETFMKSMNGANLLDANSSRNLDALKYAESGHYVKTEITTFGAGVGNLVDSTVKKTRGVCTIQEGKLKANENLILTGLIIGHANPADTVTDATQMKYSTVDDAALVQPLAHGTIIIEQEDRRVLELPIDRFYQGAASDRSRENEGWNFDTFRLIKADTPFEVKLELPSAVVPGASKKVFFYVGFKGWVTRL